MYRGMNLKYGMLCSLMLLYLLGGQWDVRMTIPVRWMITDPEIKKS